MNREETAAMFRRNLYNFQVEAGFSECELSRIIGKSEGYIQSISSGRNFPSFSAFMDICEATGRSPVEFFLDENTAAFLEQLDIGTGTLTEEQLTRILSFVTALQAEN